uniref:Heme-binding protein n=1 Tax=Rhodosorus marinus TaxID=101924 RepID=A0A7S3E9Q7_9RHOD|mmetsp:Transcript_16734/g.68517  ORF Transcript_16734/g.68517 Transcript_16734/m.68517 type:complete len:360 (+) Transcript_16734:57-1136(+)
MEAFIGLSGNGIGVGQGREVGICGRVRRFETDGEKTASWREELRILLDRNTSMDTRGVLLFDMFKQSPEIAEELAGEVCEKSGADGVRPVLNQIVNDILPELPDKAPVIASKVLKDLSELPTTIPKAVEDIREFSQTNSAELPELLRREAMNVMKKTPEGLETPDYSVVLSTEHFEVREYGSYVIAETTMPGKQDYSEAEAVQASANGFNTLAGYIFGGNEEGEKISMTTPVVMDRTDDISTMSFVLPSKYSMDSAPPPNSPKVTVKETATQLFACKEFPGFATEGETKRQLATLKSYIGKEPGISMEDSDRYQLLQYNPPYTLPWLRRNEVMIPVIMNAEVKAEEAEEAEEAVAPESE